MRKREIFHNTAELKSLCIKKVKENKKQNKHRNSKSVNKEV